MSDELLEIVKEFFRELFNSRLFALSVVFTVMFAGLLGKLFQMQVLDRNEYQETYIQRTEESATTLGSKGSVFDRNGNRLAYNELAYSVAMQDLGDYPRPSSRNQMLYCLVRILDRRGETMEGKFEITLDQNGEMFFTSSPDFTRARFSLNFYSLSSTTSLNNPKGRYPANITAKEVSERRKVDYKLDKMKDEKDNPLVMPDNIALGMINTIYTMKLTEYQKYEAIAVATNVSNETMVEVNENAADLKDIKVEQSYVCRYEDSVYFAPIIGYADKVQEDQLPALNEQWYQSGEAAGLPEGAPDKYDLNDIVDRVGVEESMGLELQGKKGYSRMYVDNMRRPREIIEKTDAKARDDVYLTIDRDLQIAIYKLTEQQLAGIISYHLQYDDLDPDRTYDPSKIPVPVKNTYYQLTGNDVLSLMGISQEGVSDIKKQIYSKYEASREQILAAIRNGLLSFHALAVSDLPKDMVTYVGYIYAYLLDGSIGVIQEDKIDQFSPEYQAWREGTINLRDYIYSGITGDWVNTTRLGVTSKYSDADDIFAQLVGHVIGSLRSDNKFTKHMLRYPISDGVITGRELCLALYAQDVLTYNAQAIAALQMGDSAYTYRFIKERISNLELAPAQPALDPCTAGVVVTDAETGEVRALVTYPNYDNNLMSGGIDAAYFSQLQDDISEPLYNNATQARKTPGSTFRPVAAVAALGGGVIGLQDIIECTGIYDQISKPIKHWIWPSRHSSENIEEGIQNSCNYFFAELIRRLCMKPDSICLPDQGLATPRRYAALFGLDHTSGVEISKNKPQISSEDPERSAMGRGTYSYTNVQLSRYMAAPTNRGNVFGLSLLDKPTDSDGSLIKDYTPAVSSHVDVADNIWNTVQTGMHRVITDNSAKGIFSDFPVKVAGKTGTAQKDKSRSNHAFFVPFAPYSRPEIAVTVGIPYDYAGTSAAALGERVYKYYYEYTTLEQIESSGALGVPNVNIGD